MTIDRPLLGIGAAILAVILTVFMPVSKRRANQTIIAFVIAVLIFVAAFLLFDPPIALPIAVGATVVVVVGRFLLGAIRSALYHNITRYTRRDFWQRRVGQAILGGRRRRS